MFEIPTPNVMILVGEAFGKLLCDEDGALMNRISVLTRRHEILPHSLLSAMWEQSLQIRKGTLTEPDHAGTLILDFHSLEAWEINFCCL